MARPVKEADEKLIYDLACIACTHDEIARIVGMSVETLTQRYLDLIQDGYANAKMSLRRAQFHKAVNEGDTNMLKWLGKQLLRQYEKVEHVTANPLEAKTDQELERIILEASEKIRNGTRLITSGKD